MVNIKLAIKEIKNTLGDRINTSKAICDIYGENETYFDHMPPDAVAFPETTSANIRRTFKYAAF